MSSELSSLVRYLANLFGGGHNSGYYESRRRDHHGRHYHYKERAPHYLLSTVADLTKGVFDRLRLNRWLLLVVLMGALATGALFRAGVFWIGGKLMELAGPFLADIDRNGLKGALDGAIQLIARIWEGSGK